MILRSLVVVELGAHLAGCDGRVADIELLHLGEAIDGLRDACNLIGGKTDLCVLELNA